MEKILIVDDEEKITRVIRAYLEREGFAVTVAHDGLAALRLAQSGNYSLIILDLMLPGMAGEDICRRLREAANPVPVIMLTAKGAFERFYRAGPSRTRATGGSGIGLAIVQEMAEAMGGYVRVASEPGSGSTFRVHLRKSK